MSSKKRRGVTYQLLIHVDEPVTVRVGRLGECAFAPGFYVYTGSARRGMKARLTRHLSKDKRLHWHIDHLLADAHATVVDVHLYFEPECAVNQRTPGTIPAPGFGASDCRAGCGAHLKRLPR
ncbi:GIY-YIG nuclease family protein [Thioalkalivibrio thiocyanodenitrificans]|uniref:GIY-YIG nuclease family protein n=1 Tax=Thioalkalivibrio thiocyanodenitrificans TaxID=243063 RepID=UPI0018DB15A3|nr:GIY-YIG nuclease family protein [Thioalkalivibrio thiocyanodenitrificans]